jgi:cytoskeletal protein CcmA (bactofilin family)
VKANIKAKECLVSGTLDGDIIVTDTLELEKTSKVNGNISAKRLTVHNGAALTGHCNMKEESKTSEW